MLANPAAAATIQPRRRRSSCSARSLSVGDGRAGPPGRPRARRWRRPITSGADVLHHPLTVPAPRARGASVLTLHDVLHREHAGHVQPRRARLPPAGLRARGAQRHPRRHGVRALAGADRRAASGSRRIASWPSTRASTTRASPRPGRRRRAARLRPFVLYPAEPLAAQEPRAPDRGPCPCPAGSRWCSPGAPSRAARLAPGARLGATASSCATWATWTTCRRSTGPRPPWCSRRSPRAGARRSWRRWPAAARWRHPTPRPWRRLRAAPHSLFPSDDVAAMADAIRRVTTDEPPARASCAGAGSSARRGSPGAAAAERHTEVYADALRA